MSNRQSSATRQIATIVALGLVWAVARALNRRTKKQPPTSVYSIYPAIYGTLSLLLFVADIYGIPAVLRSKLAIGATELAALKPELIRRSQRIALRYDAGRRIHYQQVSDRVLIAAVALPLTLMFDNRLRRDWASLGILYAWLHALNYTFYTFSPLGPAFVDKYRPVVYYTDLATEERGRGNNRNAHYSGHTASAACSSFFMAKVYSDYSGGMDRTQCTGLYLLALIPPMLLGWLRTKALKHFPSDVLLATAIGGTFGFMLPELYSTDSQL